MKYMMEQHISDIAVYLKERQAAAAEQKACDEKKE